MINEKLLESIKLILTNELYFKKESENYFSQEIYCDYRDRLSESTIAGLMEDTDPYAAFLDLLGEWAMEYTDTYIHETIREVCSSLSMEEQEIWEEEYDEIVDWFFEHVFYYYPTQHFNQEVKVNIMLDTGNGNYDFTRDNILNYYSSWYGSWENGEFPDESSILWLAKQQGKEKEVREACLNCFREDGDYVDREADPDPFVESVVQELENLPSHMATLTFLVNMKLFDLFELKQAIVKEEKLNDFYDASQRKGTGYIVVSKDTMCGLFDPWHGGGSVLEIELDKDVVIPVKYIWTFEVEGAKSKYGYSVNEVYGLIDSCWDGKVKEICPMEGEINNGRK